MINYFYRKSIHGEDREGQITREDKRSGEEEEEKDYGWDLFTRVNMEAEIGG